MKKLLITAILLISIIRLYAEAPRLMLQSGHKSSSSINCLRFSPDGKMLASASEDQTIKVWDVATGLLIYDLVGHEKEVTHISFNSKGDLLVSASADRSIRLWNLETGKLMKVFRKHQFQVSGVEFIYGTNTFISIGKDSYIFKWDVTQKDPIGNFSERKPLSSIVMAKDGTFFAVAGEEGTIKLRGLNPDRQIFPSLEGHNTNVTSMALSEDGKTLASRESDSTVLIWDMKESKSIRKFQGFSYGIGLSPDGRYFCSAVEENNAIILRNVYTNDSIVFIGHDDAVNTFSFSPDGQLLASGSSDGKIRIWSIASRRSIHVLTGVIQNVNDLVSVNNMLFSVNDDNFIRMWNLEDGSAPVSIATKIGNLFSVSASQDGKFIALGGVGGDYLELYDLSKNEFKSFKTPQNLVSCTRIDFNSKYFAACSENSLYVYELPSCKTLAEFKAEDNISRIAFSPNSEIISAGSNEGKIYSWNINSNKLIYKISSHASKISDLCFSATGDTLFSAGDDGKINLINAQNGSVIHEFPKSHAGTQISTIALSKSGRFLASGAYDNNINIYDLNSDFKIIRKISRAHANIVNKITFGMDDKMLISGSTDGVIKLWDIQKADSSTATLATLTNINKNDWAVVSADGHFDGSPEGVRNLHWVDKDQPLLIEAFFEKLFYPSLLPALQNDVLKRRMTKAVAVLNLPPLVTINSTADTLTTDSVKLKIEIESRKTPCSELRIFANDKLVKSEIFDNPITGKYEKEYTLYLTPEFNSFRAIAIDKEQTESFPAEIKIFRTGEKPKSNLYIIAIGISDYKNPKFHLPFARLDQEAVTATMLKRATNIAKETKLYSFINSQAEKSAVINAFNEVAKKAKPEDIFVFYFVGHGTTCAPKNSTKADFYLVLHSVMEWDYNQLVNQGLSSQELRSLMVNVSANKQLVIIDACKSGKLVSDIASDTVSVGGQAVARLARSSGLTVISSTSASSPAYEHIDLGHGIFSYVMLEGLNGKAANMEHDILVVDLKAYIDTGVPEKCKSLGVEQHPDGRSQGQNFRIGNVQE
ncbi:MAG: caspase family protein [Candidatus Kapabacteria bacterium]|nr:caspase family protein [Candidatus Kapabacteria bacterium]